MSNRKDVRCQYSKRMLEIAVQLLDEFPPLDRLPYSPDMARFAAEFSRRAGREVSVQEAWGTGVSARKRGMALRRMLRREERKGGR